MNVEQGSCQSRGGRRRPPHPDTEGAGVTARVTRYVLRNEFEGPRGAFTARIRGDAVDWELSYEGLEGTITTASHIHLGQKDVNGGVSVFFCSGPTTPPCTPGSGTFSGTFTAADVIGPTAQGIAPGEFAEVLRAMRAGVTYANVHTNKHPGGEIRGQLKPGGGDDED